MLAARTGTADYATKPNNSDLCQEYFDGAEVSSDHVVGAVNVGGSVASMQLAAEWADTTKC